MPRCFDLLLRLRNFWQAGLQAFRAPTELEESSSGGVLVVESDSDSDSPLPTAVGGAGDSLDWWQVVTDPGPSPAVLALAGGLRRGPDGPKKIARAYHRGRQAASIRRGELGAFHGARCDLRIRYYVVLATGRNIEPFYTRDYGTYNTAVKYPNGNFDIQSISHGFAAEAEVRAFCLGAGFEGLHRLR